MPKGYRAVRIVDHRAACQFHNERKQLGDVVAWNVSENPNGRFVAHPNCAVKRGAPVRLEAETLEDLRKLLPPGLTYYEGVPGGVLEVWI